MKITLTMTLTMIALPSFALSNQIQTKQVNYLKSLQHWSYSCTQLKSKPKKIWHYHSLLHNQWGHVCKQWSQAQISSETKAKAFFQQHFQKRYEVKDNVLITGYYAPVMHACWMKQPGCEVPIYGLPKRRLQHLSRKQINQHNRHSFPILAWTSRVDRFFLQVQGSGELIFNSGDYIRLGYAGKNQLPYSSIGKYLIRNKLIERKDLNMQGIRHYLKTHPKKQRALFEHNAAFIFFKVKTNNAVVGKLGAALKANLSAAVDNKWIPLGSLIEVKTTDPFNHKHWNMLLTAQDTGGAIRGRRHIDIYMGKGKQAGHWAGNMHQSGHLTYYIPR